jgi:hypothetical protein
MTNTQITALITAIQDGGLNTALEVRNVLTAIKNACVLPNEVKWIKLQNSEIATYFVITGETAGLGLSGQLYEGWAICNGNNDTSNDSGRVSIAYGTGYTTLGEKDGSKDAVVVAHTHNIAVNTNASGSGFPAFEASSTQGSFATESTGVDGTNKNLQPYVVELKIQRIA